MAERLLKWTVMACDWRHSDIMSSMGQRIVVRFHYSLFWEGSSMVEQENNQESCLVT